MEERSGSHDAVLGRHILFNDRWAGEAKLASESGKPKCNIQLILYCSIGLEGISRVQDLVYPVRIKGAFESQI